MAQVAFDRLVKFCERYHAAALDILSREQRGDELIDPSELRKIRRKWALWLSGDVEESLRTFEDGVGDPAARGYDRSGAPTSNEDYANRAIARLRNALHIQELNDFRDGLINQIGLKSKSLQEPSEDSSVE